jgi:hypothetical protein
MENVYLNFVPTSIYCYTVLYDNVKGKRYLNNERLKSIP